MKKLYLFIALALILAAGCKKEKDPVVKNDRVEAFTDHAVFNWEVEYAEQAASVVELGSSSSMGDARRYGSESPTGNKVFTVTVPQLAENTVYYYRYLVLVGDKTFTMDLQHFTTPKTLVPSVTTLDVTGITGTTATVSGQVTDDHGVEVTECGFCWATHETPDMNDHVVACEVGTDVFTAQLTGLLPNTVYYVRAFAKNADVVAYGASLSFQTTASVPVVSTLSVDLTTAITVNCEAEVVNDGGAEVIERGVCFGPDEHRLFVENDHVIASTAGIGPFSVVIDALSTCKEFFFRAYAVNSMGVGYGEILSVTTGDGLPVVHTLSVDEITHYTAVCTGEVVDQGLSSVRERGFCWNLTGSPTVDDFHIPSLISDVGVYSCMATNLSDGMEYHLRAYCKNRQGVAYGEEIVFTTLPILPEMTTWDVTDITAHSARCGGRVESDGGHVQMERGICWSTSPNPTADGNHVIDPALAGGSEDNSFMLDMTGLSANTAYHVRAYVTTSVGVTYGEEKTFTTLSE